MPADTPTVGYPAHAVQAFAWDVNDYGVRTNHWLAQCGVSGSDMGRFLRAGSVRRLELCPTCFPGRDHNSCSLAKPVEIEPTEWDRYLNSRR